MEARWPESDTESDIYRKSLTVRDQFHFSFLAFRKFRIFYMGKYIDKFRCEFY